jgi:hypothetical protein
MHPNQAKLKQARKEIEAVFKKYDIAGFAALHAPGWGEQFWNIWPSYSILTGDFPVIRIKSKLSDYAGDVKAQIKDQEDTAGMMKILSQSTAELALQFLELSKELDTKLGAEYTDDRFIPDPSKHNPGTH